MNELVNEDRKKMPDIDDLRHLNMTLQKSGVTLVDAMRACSILSRLDELGIGINELSGIISEETAKEVLRLDGEKVRLEGELKSVEGNAPLLRKTLKIY